MKLGSWFAILGCVGVTVTASIASQGCTATVSTGDGTGDDTGTGTGNPPTTGEDSGTPAAQEDSGSVPLTSCDDCLYGQCAGVYSLCVGDTGCLAIYQCATAPSCVSDAACVTACVNAQSAAAQALYGNLSTCDYEGQCNAGTCATVCNPSADYCTSSSSDDAGGGIDSGDAPASDDAGQNAADSAVPPQTCAQCQSTNCSSQITDCAAGTACGTYNQCVLGCSTAECATICGTNDPSGVTAAQALGTCTTTNCAVCSQ